MEGCHFCRSLSFNSRSRKLKQVLFEQNVAYEKEITTLWATIQNFEEDSKKPKVDLSDMADIVQNLMLILDLAVKILTTSSSMATTFSYS